ncbi:MAG: DUF362 domain-containing protein [Verrucomicrobiota bacterium]
MNENRKGAVVAIAHTNQKHRTIERITSLVEAALLEMGGCSQFVPPGATVLIKPNQTVYYSAEEGCTTDPMVVGALIRLCKKAGAARVQVAESSGGFFSSMPCMRITGMAAMAEKEGAELVDLGSDAVPNRKVPIPHGVVMKEVPLPAPLLDADVIIDVPKAKNHHIEPISGALKNWVGSVNQNWRNFNHGNEEMFDRFLDIMSITKPTLCVVDGLICGEGDGPIANRPHWGGCILASTDPVATDVSIARLLKRDWTKLKFARIAEERGLGVRDPIEYRGVPMEEVAFDTWAPHEGYDYLPLNFLVGNGVTLEGTIGHVKSVLDSMLARGEIGKVLALRGTPTIMIGETEDPDFEQHLTEGPYIVFDDAAKVKYKTDPRVYFVPGHPVLQTAMPELMKGLGLEIPGKTKMNWEQLEGETLQGISIGSPMRKALAVGKPAGMVAALLGTITAGSFLVGRAFSRAGVNAH